MRAALHAHILCWFRPRVLPPSYQPIPVIPRTAPGTEQRQRPVGAKVEPLKELQHDHVYHAAHIAPMTAELVRPDVSGDNWGGYDLDRLRVAGLARAVQTRLPYLHHCTLNYCLKGRSKCRFFFPWPYQPHQVNFSLCLLLMDDTARGHHTVCVPTPTGCSLCGAAQGTGDPKWVTCPQARGATYGAQPMEPRTWEFDGVPRVHLMNPRT